MLELTHGVKYTDNTLIFPKSSCAVCYREGNLLLVKQDRQGHISLEIPGGVCNPCEDDISAAMRELLEESGYTAKGGKVLFTIDLDTSISVHQTSLVFMEGIEKTDLDKEFPAEWHNIPDLIEMIDNHQITHAPTVIAILKIWEMRTGGKL